MHTMSFWHLLTRLGEAEILLPVALLTAAALLLREGKRKLALVWLALIAGAAVLTTASKIAFIGWGLGVAAINFTGISGHTMFASAIYPLLLVTLVARGARASFWWALGLGCAMALLIGISRIMVGAHSWSEVLAGWLVGGAATALVFALCGTERMVLRPLVPLLLLAWVSVTPVQMPGSQTHSLVTRLALGLSGHVVPYTRRDLLRSAEKNNS